MDMSMHEINEAAEAITAAADRDANIIFGATINPELDGEVIVTVIATGFDSSYFGERPAATPVAAMSTSSGLMSDSDDDDDSKDSPLPSESPRSFSPVTSSYGDDTQDIEGLGVDLNIPDEDEQDEHDFKNDKPTASIWSMDDNAEKSSEEEILDKPSFLRRLTKRKSKKTEETEQKSE
jgi:hypothetical protein